MITTFKIEGSSKDEIRERAESFIELLEPHCVKILGLEIEDGFSQVGGGSLPMWNIPTYLVGFHPANIKPDTVSDYFRKQNPPVVGRIQKDTFYLDLRTVSQEDTANIKSVTEKFAAEISGG